MPDLSGFSGRQVASILQKMDFEHIRTKSSHAILRRGSNVYVVPLHGELASGTLKSILRQAGLTKDEFLAKAG